MRGGTVAVMDVKKIDGAEGVRFYECDVGDRGQVERVWAKIVDDVGRSLRRRRNSLYFSLQC